jgi:hypothetical protein
MGEASRHLRTIHGRATGTFVANLPKATLPKKAEILAAAFDHGRVALQGEHLGRGAFSPGWLIS